MGKFLSYEEFINEKVEFDPAKGKDNPAEVDFIEGIDYADKEKSYFFWVGKNVRWQQANRWLEGEILAIKKPKPTPQYGDASNNPNEWSVTVKSKKSGSNLHTKVYLLFNKYNEEITKQDVDRVENPATRGYLRGKGLGIT